jgi:hypothetical protein
LKKFFLEKGKVAVPEYAGRDHKQKTTLASRQKAGSERGFDF